MRVQEHKAVPTRSQERRAVLIVNPNAGRNRAAAAREVETFSRRALGRGVAVRVEQTAGPDDAARLAAEAVSVGATDLVVRGGDGTVHEAIQGLVGADVRLMVWPAGTANVLARQLESPSNAEAAAEVFLRCNTRRISLGRATVERTGAHRYFFMLAGVGLDASVVRHVRPRLKRRVGGAAVWHPGVGALLQREPRELALEIECGRTAATYAAISQ